MNLFKCQHCAQLLYFENRSCERCAHKLGYLAEMNTLTALQPDCDAWRALAAPGSSYRFCANSEPDACNWLVLADTPENYCRACRHNGTIPNLTSSETLLAWRK